MTFQKLYDTLKGEERETNKMQLIRCLLSNFYLDMFRASLCPSSGEQECALPHMVFCTVTRGEHKDTTALTSYGFVPLLLQCRTPYAAVHTIVLLMMGIMMLETCWDSLIINIRLVASCWSLSLHPFLQVLSWTGAEFVAVHVTVHERKQEGDFEINNCSFWHILQENVSNDIKWNLIRFQSASSLYYVIYNLIGIQPISEKNSKSVTAVLMFAVGKPSDLQSSYNKHDIFIYAFQGSICEWSFNAGRVKIWVQRGTWWRKHVMAASY